MIRKAVLDDVKSIHRLLQTYSRKGELLARPLSKFMTISVISGYTKILTAILSRAAVPCSSAGRIWLRSVLLRLIRITPVKGSVPH